jgi:uncharacterized protein
MKYLILVLVVVVVGWLLLRERKPRPPAARSAAGKAAPQAMVQCSHCGLHLPRGEALLDDRGAFCSEAHRLAGPRAG